jgi:hypothetical protein
MWPEKVGGIAMRAEVRRTEVRYYRVAGCQELFGLSARSDERALV